MKKNIILLIFISICNCAFSQTKIDKYCQVQIDPKNGFTTKEIASISFGKNDSLFSFKDSSVILNLQKVNSLTSSTDVLNYMSDLGWGLVNIIPFGLYTSHERLYFKKEFNLSELNENK